MKIFGPHYVLVAFFSGDAVWVHRDVMRKMAAVMSAVGQGGLRPENLRSPLKYHILPVGSSAAARPPSAGASDPRSLQEDDVEETRGTTPEDSPKVSLTGLDEFACYGRAWFQVGSELWRDMAMGMFRDWFYGYGEVENSSKTASVMIGSDMERRFHAMQRWLEERFLKHGGVRPFPWDLEV